MKILKSAGMGRRVSPMLCAGAVALTLGALGSCTHVLPASKDSVAAHVAEAERLAGADLKALLPLCKPAPASRPTDIDKLLATQIARPAPPAGKVFDNLYFVGAAWVSAWAINTSQGILLIDALNNDDEARRLIDGGLRSVGLDPANIRQVLITHAHGDHYGGIGHLTARYGPSVIMSEEDWKQAHGTLEFDSTLWGRPPRFQAGRDRMVNAGDTVRLGETEVRIHITPGHTHGTVTPTFDVREGGRTHRVMLWGGTAFNFGKDLPRLESYIEATDRMAVVAQREGVDVMVSNHASYDGAIEKMAAMRAGAGANPFVIGTDSVVRALKVMGACARAQRDRFLIE